MLFNSIACLYKITNLFVELFSIKLKNIYKEGKQEDEFENKKVIYE